MPRLGDVADVPDDVDGFGLQQHARCLGPLFRERRFAGDRLHPEDAVYASRSRGEAEGGRFSLCRCLEDTGEQEAVLVAVLASIGNPQISVEAKEKPRQAVVRERRRLVDSGVPWPAPEAP